jgi:hypothetical protein
VHGTPCAASVPIHRPARMPLGLDSRFPETLLRPSHLTMIYGLLRCPDCRCLRGRSLQRLFELTQRATFCGDIVTLQRLMNSLYLVVKFELEIARKALSALLSNSASCRRRAFSAACFSASQTIRSISASDRPLRWLNDDPLQLTTSSRNWLGRIGHQSDAPGSGT